MCTRKNLNNDNKKQGDWDENRNISLNLKYVYKLTINDEL